MGIADCWFFIDEIEPSVRTFWRVGLRNELGEEATVALALDEATARLVIYSLAFRGVVPRCADSLNREVITEIMGICYEVADQARERA